MTHEENSLPRKPEESPQNTQDAWETALSAGDSDQVQDSPELPKERGLHL